MKTKRNLPALLAIAVVSALGLSGIVAGSASALNACGLTAAIEGQGSSLQKLAQSVWISKSLTCKVTYTASGSGAGLEAFGVGGAKKLNLSDTFIGTDDAPSGGFATGQLGEIEVATGGKEPALLKQALVIPVAQAAIAMIVKYPTNCSLKENKISNPDLQKIWHGLLTKWEEVTGHEGVGCNTAITRVVRNDVSGTTYQFKHYLFVINKGVLDCVTTGTKTWAALQAGAANLLWPETCAEHTLSTVRHAATNGGGGEVSSVETLAGSIGYANLADARKGFAGGVRWLQVENGTSFAYPGTPTASEPTATVGEANCGETEYEIEAVKEIVPDVDWSGVYGGKTNATKYPICTLTWDVALMNYFTAGYTKAGEVGMVTKEYLEYITKTGQTDFAKNDYTELPTAIKTIAQKLAELIAKA